MNVLGISAFHRDAAAALVVDGRPVAAVAEERFTKKAHDGDFPSRAVRHCLEAGGVEAGGLDRVVFYQKPLRRFERVLATRLQGFPRSTRAFASDMFLWLGDRLWMKGRIAGDLGVEASRIAFVAHQQSLATLALRASGVERAALLVVGDGGEWAATSLGRGEDGVATLLEETHLPHSLGRVAAALTQFLGFVPGADGGRTEALAAHGTARQLEVLRTLVPAGAGGTYSVDTGPFRFQHDDERLYGPGLERLLGPARFPGQPLEHQQGATRHADLAASLQALLEERVLALAARLHERVPLPDLCLTGELARNRRLVARLAREGPFERVHVPADPGEAGAALGAALAVEQALRGGPAPEGSIETVQLGESIGSQEQEGALVLTEPLAELSRRLAEGEGLAWVRGPLELADESLGQRVILADACREAARTRLLGAVQQGEPWLPCRLALPAERAGEYVDLPAVQGGTAIEGLATERLTAAAPDAVQPGGRVWCLPVVRERDPELHELLTRVEQRSGHPLLLLETFRLRGSPVVRNEADAVDAFGRSGLDALVAGTRLYAREAAAPQSPAGT